MQTASIVRENGNLSTLFFNCDDFFFRPIGKADTGFFRPISPVGLNTGSAFSPFCATSASASPRGRRERTVVRPLALGLASLNSHQTDENASLGRPISPVGLNTGSGSAYFAIAQYGYARALFRPLGSIRARLTSPPACRGCEVRRKFIFFSPLEKNFLTPPSTTRISRPRRRDETSPRHDENRR